MSIGVFQKVVAGEEKTEKLEEILELLQTSSNPQVEYIIRVINKWAKTKQPK